MRPSRTIFWILTAWVLLVGSYALVSSLMAPGPRLTAFGDIAQCLVPLFANAGLLLNAGSPNWRRNAFWMLLAMGCTLWMIGQLQWTYFEIYLNKPVPNPFAGDVIMFLHVMPMIGALALQPHKYEPDRSFRFGQLDFVLLLFWWVYLYLFMVIPWQYVYADPAVYLRSYIRLATLENIVLIAGLGVLCLRAARGWRMVYAHLFGAAALYAIASGTLNLAIARSKYYTGSLYDLPLLASFVWFGMAGILARRVCPQAEPVMKSPEVDEAREVADQAQPDGVWPSRLAMAAVLSLPVLAIWSLVWSTAPEPIRHFRLLITLAAILPLSFLVFLRQHMLDADRLRLLRASQQSIENLRHLQTQFVQAEKLASLGQLAAGAAHEINNPLTAILGYSDLLVDDVALGERPRGIAAKIGEQARRTKQLVKHLLSFARQVPVERKPLDVNTIVSSAVQLRALDLRGKNIRIELQAESVLPAVRGDANQLLQVFFNIISNGVDAIEEVGGGKLTVQTLRERGNVVVLFSDTGPGIKEPQHVFDPFYTTKPVGKGTGLGLSICYGLVQEHGGQISCSNRSEGGATFRIELPAMLAVLPLREPVPHAEISRKSSGSD